MATGVAFTSTLGVFTQVPGDRHPLGTGGPSALPKGPALLGKGSPSIYQVWLLSA